ncbi:adenosylcobinamide-phosphate synthase CbiB [Paenibacillus sp. MER TA 81-3]|uniref:adenosylcobinamide-phosphate synthase CbiB n=1 Tax=Paenibacillus sp. MER TA 81-3 TaxID=2939573 RepID=UPI00204020FF|nr:adenosylcobinamide-phosphate synthase CbiB [Paenibacillus sp. MER TA 81-3]MCM3338423.1 adenosylcobinamide-phosphate synthase CbiB [Paenibacillus sp. MER TA 81-3]
MIAAFIIIAAYIWDRIIGDPRWIPHPVIMIGKAITALEHAIRKAASSEAALKPLGILLPVIVVGGSYALTWALLWGLHEIHFSLAWAAEAILIGTTIATKGLKDAGMAVYKRLAARDIDGARREVGMIVGRDTDELDEPEVVRATVETVAENIVDAVISPLCYALIGGAPLAMAYRAVNTLDSMVGYKNEKYGNLGWASARLDDIANWIPARLTAVLMAICAWMKGYDGTRAWQTAKRDAPRHPSPNSGWPEAAAAGALGVRLGGYNVYKGVRSLRAYMGDEVQPLQAQHIPAACSLLTGSTLGFTVIAAVLLYARGGWLL